ncbi:DUF4367 domain-containing protein [Cohnella fermenti]|uniref:DUF4367 domain-containing protein n=1 Tax=Cohnella fermenti TaxID=2565925 RepID=A0A4S4C9B1_9BACL|nr:DUF4367 domain-containing protein [Cohnella fermenti]THF84594.1 DUF4367 domain-containing protein [Cohnella fermenti]
MQDEFDKLFDAAFDEAVKKHTAAPSPDRLWEKTEQLLHRKSKRRRRLRSLPLIACSFALGAFAFGAPKASEAFDPFFQKVKQFPEGIVNVIFGTAGNSDGAKTAPPPEFETAAPAREEGAVADGTEVGASDRQDQFTSWEEVRKLHDWLAPADSAIPAGYKRIRVTAIYESGSGRLGTVIGQYESSDGKELTIHIHKLVEKEGGGMAYDTSSGTLEKVVIKGEEAYLFLPADGYSTLDWISGKWRVSIVGHLEREALIALANGIG